MGKLILISEVEGFEGECRPTWINRSQIDQRLGGYVSGFFKLVKDYGILGKYKTGKQFHGKIIKGKVLSTAIS